MKVNKSIFREYDVRGIAGREFNQRIVDEYKKFYGEFPGITLNLETAEAIGKAYGTIIRKAGGNSVVVGMELRPFAEELTDALIGGIRSTGCTVTSLGIALTPIVYFITAFKKFDGGINVTGSHNIYFFNGFKLMKKDVWPLFGSELQALREIIEREEFLKGDEGEHLNLDGYHIYEDYFLKHIRLERKLKVVIDSGNGSAGMFAPNVFRKLGCEVVELYSEPDATFPNHPPDPESKQSLVVLQKTVVAEKADVGIAFDADGDRTGFVDERGNCIDIDLIMLVFAKDILSRHPGKKILFDIKSSQLLSELVPGYGGVPLMHRTGHAPFKETLRKDQEIVFAGEASGHLYLVEDYFRVDDGLFAAGKMLEIFTKHQGTFSSLFKDIPTRIRTPEFKLPCPDEKKFEIMEQIVADLKNNKSISNISLIDGIRFSLGAFSWAIVRASNTSPYLTIRAEAENEPELIRVKNFVADELEKFSDIGDHLNRQAVATLTGKLGWV